MHTINTKKIIPPPLNGIAERSFEFTVCTPRYGGTAIIKEVKVPMSELSESIFALLFNNCKLKMEEIRYLWKKFENIDYSYYKNYHGYEINT